MKDLVSIIVPVYNVSRYLDNCFQSLSNQTYRDLEVVIVDDGSTDDSLDICIEWSRRDDRFKVFHQSNKGVNAARRFALENASGEYIMFCDSDDLLDERAVETAVELSVTNGSDLIVFNAIQSDGKEFWGNAWPNCSSITGDQSLAMLLSGMIRWNIWLMCAKRILFENVYIPTNVALGEDLVIFYQLLGNASKVTITDKQLYKYMIREESASKTDECVPMHKQEQNQDDVLSVLLLLRHYILQKCPSQSSLCNLFLLRRSYSAIRAISCMKVKSGRLLTIKYNYLSLLESIYGNIQYLSWKDILKMMLIRSGIINIRLIANKLPD